MSLGPLYVLLGEVSVQVLRPFFNCFFCLPGVELCEFFLYFGDQTVVQGIVCKYIFPYGWFPFHFADVFISCVEAFYFDESPFVYSCLYVPCTRRHIRGYFREWGSSIPQDKVIDFPLGGVSLLRKDAAVEPRYIPALKLL